jgi:hypothetical protein
MYWYRMKIILFSFNIMLLINYRQQGLLQQLNQIEESSNVITAGTVLRTDNSTRLSTEVYQCAHFDLCQGIYFSISNPDSIRSTDPDPESGPGSRRAKITHKNGKKVRNFMF